MLLSQDDKYRSIYDQIMADTSDTWNILLLELGGLNSNGKSFYLKSCANASVYFSKDILGELFRKNKDSLYTNRLTVILKQLSDINGFYAGDCTDYVSSHSSELLIIKNWHLNKWIEAYSGRGSLKEVLYGKDDYAWLLALCNYIEDIKSK